MDDDQIHAELANSVDIGTITTHFNVGVLQRLRDNDPKLTKLILCHEMYRGRVGAGVGNDFAYYCPSADEDLQWAGAFVGNSVNLQKLFVSGRSFPEETNHSLSMFLRGVSCNTSIRGIEFDGIDLSSNGDILRELEPFFENNANLRYVKIWDCQFGGEGDRLLASMLRGCQSLNLLHLQRNLDGDERPTSIVAALNTHTKLKYLHLRDMNVGSNGCRSLAALPVFPDLIALHLPANNIDDDGVEALTGALQTGSSLQWLDLSCNPSVTTRGLQSIADALEHPITNLVWLNLLWNGVDDEGADILARALANNRKLMSLMLVAGDDDRDAAARVNIAASDNLITAPGWQAFADALCNTSSVEATYQSNHILQSLSRSRNNLPRIEDEDDDSGGAILSSLAFSLGMNRRGPRKEAARRKIIEHHLSSDEGMGHFAGIDRAVLPRVLAWVPDDELSLLYCVVRNFHSELDSVPTSAESPAGPHA